MTEQEMNAQRELLCEALKEYLQECRDAAKEWQDKAQKAWDMVHGRVNWSHKNPKQSKIHVNRVGLALEQVKAQLRQGLISFDEWLGVENEVGAESPFMSANEARRLVWRGIDRTNPRTKIAENAGIAAIENVLATKLQPVIIDKKIRGKSVKELHIEHLSLNIRNYYPDPAMGGLYEFHEVTQDKHRLFSMASDKPTRDKPYRLEALKTLEPTLREEEQQEASDRGTDVPQEKMRRRKQILLHEFWGTVLDKNGDVMVWKREDGSELKLENVVITMANELVILGDPLAFPTLDGESCFVVTQLLHTNLNPYGRSLLAPGVDMNRAEDELISSGVDAALKEGLNVNVLKVHGLVNKQQAEGGIKYGMTLFQNNQLAPGERLLESASTGQVPQGLLQILGIIKSAGNENMRLNDIAISGNMPSKQVRATELVSANNTISGLFEAIAADIEDVYLERYARKVFLLMLQHAAWLSDEDLMYVFFGNKQRVEAFKGLIKSEKSVFEELAGVFRFRGKGLRSMAANNQMAQTLMNLMSMVVANPILMDAFQRRGLDVTKMFDDVLRGSHVDIEKFLDPNLAKFAETRQLVRENALAQAEVQGESTGEQGRGPSAPTGQPGIPGMETGGGQ